MGTKKGQVRKTRKVGRRAYEMEQYGSWGSYLDAYKQYMKIDRVMPSMKRWAIKQKGSLWAVFRTKE